MPTVRTQSDEAIKQYIEKVGGDGHTIFKDSFIRDMGFTDEFVDRFCSDHESGEGVKSTIFSTKDGKPMPECRGVYGLNFIWGIADDIGADTQIASGKMGRGFQAQELAVAIQKKLEETA
jgi:hypothetical protein